MEDLHGCYSTMGAVPLSSVVVVVNVVVVVLLMSLSLSLSLSFVARLFFLSGDTGGLPDLVL